MRRFSILIALLGALYPACTQAQQPAPAPAKVAQDQGRLCNAGCAEQFRACAGQPGAKSPPACNTGYIRCTLNCLDCADDLAQCASRDAAAAPNTDFAACSAQFATCRKKFTSAAPDALPLITFEGGDGASQQRAVAIKGAQTTREGIRAEALWAALMHPQLRKGHQALVSGDNGRKYDVIDYAGASGAPITIYFDITDFFGKGF